LERTLGKVPEGSKAPVWIAKISPNYGGKKGACQQVCVDFFWLPFPPKGGKEGKGEAPANQGKGCYQAKRLCPSQTGSVP